MKIGGYTIERPERGQPPRAKLSAPTYADLQRADLDGADIREPTSAMAPTSGAPTCAGVRTSAAPTSALQPQRRKTLLCRASSSPTSDLPACLEGANLHSARLYWASGGQISMALTSVATLTSVAPASSAPTSTGPSWTAHSPTNTNQPRPLRREGAGDAI